jgi:hypothetical protein
MRHGKAILGITISVALIGFVIYFSGAFRFAWAIHASNEATKRQVIYHINHAALAQEVRKFAEQKRSETVVAPAAPLLMWEGDPDLPASLKILKCSSVSIFPDRVRLEFGGPFLHFGIMIFNKGYPGEGNKQLADGVWFYSEDGRVPSP